MLSKSLIQFSIDGRACVPFLLLGLRPNYGGGNEDNDDLLQKAPCTHCCTQCPRPCSRPPPTHTSARDSWTLTGKSGQSLVGSLLLSPGPGVHKVLFVPSKSLFPQYCRSSVIKSHWPPSQIPWGFSVPLPDPRVGKPGVGPRTFLTVRISLV